MINKIKIRKYINNISLLFNKIYFFKTIGSTNSKCFKLKNEDNFIVMADEQREGRGRYDRKWTSPPDGNLYFSFLIHEPELEYNKLCILTAVSVLETLEKFDKGICLKWPNDIIVKDKKLCGMLIERKFTGSKLDSVVIGIGINLFTDFTKHPELKDIAVSLNNIVTEKEAVKIDKGLIFLDFLELFEKHYIHFRKHHSRLVKKWREKISHKNENITFKIKDKVIQGKLKRIKADGSIVIESQDKIYTYQFGEVL